MFMSCFVLERGAVLQPRLGRINPFTISISTWRRVGVQNRSVLLKLTACRFHGGDNLPLVLHHLNGPLHDTLPRHPRRLHIHPIPRNTYDGLHTLQKSGKEHEG